MRPLRTHDSSIRRLDSLMCNILFGALVIALGLCVLAFVATRTHMFHGSLMRRQQEALNNMWLLQQCQSAEFYSNMKDKRTEITWASPCEGRVNERVSCGTGVMGYA